MNICKCCVYLFAIVGLVVVGLLGFAGYQRHKEGLSVVPSSVEDLSQSAATTTTTAAVIDQPETTTSQEAPPTTTTVASNDNTQPPPPGAAQNPPPPDQQSDQPSAPSQGENSSQNIGATNAQA